MITILKTVAEVIAFRASAGDKSVALVPTMGNLHDGHMSLMALAKKKADLVVASIFVNPTQFGENEDLDAYPRTFVADLEKLQSSGVDAVFYPAEHDIYPEGKNNTLSIEMPRQLTHMLCGIDRPTHFQGVATVVAKLFHITRPDVAVFGEKDFQQLAIIRRLNAELFMDIDIYGAAIVRDDNGLAMSSRNQYLSQSDYPKALMLSRALMSARQKLLAGDDVDGVIDAVKRHLAESGVKVEYLELRNIATLVKQHVIDDGILLIAARIGNSRLIDNLKVSDV